MASKRALRYQMQAEHRSNGSPVDKHAEIPEDVADRRPLLPQHLAVLHRERQAVANIACRRLER